MNSYDWVVIIFCIAWVCSGILSLIIIIISDKIEHRNKLSSPSEREINETKKMYVLSFAFGIVSLSICIFVGISMFFTKMAKWALTPKPRAETPIIYQESDYRDSAKVK